jgi:DNA polymerase-3 subunit epsilon
MQDAAARLAHVTFAVIDLETTGCSPSDCEITEVGALKFRGGERIGTFQTLVDPGVTIPERIVGITGIHDGMVRSAPGIASVLPTLLEFVGDSVIVGHNVRFDLGFLHADLTALDYLPMTNGFIDTLALARRLVRDEVPNCRLDTLARHLRTTEAPCHRAFADAAATGDVFHALLERAAGFGVFELDDLVAFAITGTPIATSSDG